MSFNLFYTPRNVMEEMLCLYKSLSALICLPLYVAPQMSQGVHQTFDFIDNLVVLAGLLTVYNKQR